MRGWYGQSYRHYLAAKGIRTNRYYSDDGFKSFSDLSSEEQIKYGEVPKPLVGVKRNIQQRVAQVKQRIKYDRSPERLRDLGYEVPEEDAIKYALGEMPEGTERFDVRVADPRILGQVRKHNIPVTMRSSVVPALNIMENAEYAPTMSARSYEMLVLIPERRGRVEENGRVRLMESPKPIDVNRAVAHEIGHQFAFIPEVMRRYHEYGIDRRTSPTSLGRVSPEEDVAETFALEHGAAVVNRNVDPRIRIASQEEELRKRQQFMRDVGIPVRGARTVREAAGMEAEPRTIVARAIAEKGVERLPVPGRFYSQKRDAR